MGLTVRNMFKIVHELCPTAMIGVQGLVNGNPYDTIALYVYPDDDGFWGEREVVQVKSETDQHLKVVSVTLSVNMDGGRSKKDVKEKMEQRNNNEPLKLLTMLAYLECDEGSDIWLAIRLEKRGENGSRYLFVEGYAKDLKNESSMFNGYYIERILYDKSEDDYDKHDLIIQAVKEEKINENNDRN